MSEPTRIAFVLDGAGLGGTERHVRDLASGLARVEGERAELHLVTGVDGPLPRELRGIGVRCHVVPRGDTWTYVANLARCLRAIRPHLVHAHSGRVACLAARLAGVPFVIETRHGLGERESRAYRNFPPLRRFEAWKSALADVSIAVCSADAAWLRDAGLDSIRRLVTIPNGIEARDLAWLAKTRSTLRRQWGVLDDRLVLGFAGRLCRQKEPERLLELSLRLAERGSDALLLIFGAGPLEAELRARARRDGIEERIRWQGVETNRDAIFPGLDLLLLPSRWEGLPYALLDALEREVPVLATPVGGVPEVLAAASLQQCAMKWEVERWADWIDEGGPRRAREELRSGGRRSVLTAFSHDRMVADTRALYGRVLGR